MSAAVDVSSSDASPRFQPFTDRDTGRREAMPPVRRSFLAIVGGRRHYAAAELLQQVIYLIEWRDCRSLSVRYLADNLDCHRDVIQTAKSRLLELGFIQLSKGSGVGGADRWYLCVHAILEALDAAGYEATRAQLLGRPDDPPRPPDQSDSSNCTAEPDDPPSGRAVRSDSPNRTAEPDKQYLQEQDNTSDSSVAGGRGRKADQERSDAATATAPNNSNLKEHIREAFDTYQESSSDEPETDTVVDLEHIGAVRTQWQKIFGEFGRDLGKGIALKLSLVYAARIEDPEKLREGMFQTPQGRAESLPARITRLLGNGISLGQTVSFLLEDVETFHVPSSSPPDHVEESTESASAETTDTVEEGSEDHFLQRLHDVYEELGGSGHFNEAENLVEEEWRANGWSLPDV